MSTYLSLRKVLERRLERNALKWFKSTVDEIADGVSDARFCSILSLASRHAKRHPLEPTEDQLKAAQRIVAGWNLERWTLLDALRVGLILSRSDLSSESGALAIEEAFRYADDGELCALYRSLALLPEPERFTWRAGEGCRTNMRHVFEAVALDTPFPVSYFDDVAWRQAVIKCVFVEAPLWRMFDLDARLSPELARMALDLADERRSANRPVQHELWLCLGPHAGPRGIESLERELDPSNSNRLGRRAAAYAIVRAGHKQVIERGLESEDDPAVAESIRDALAGNTQSTVFRNLDPTL